MAADEPIVAEPGARYARRSPLVADCSVIAALVFNEPERDAARGVLADHEVHVPGLVDYEIASVAVKKSRGGYPSVASRALDLFADFRLTRYEVEAGEQWELAMRYELSAYDAAYLWLAEKLGAPLATFDRKLGQAARRHLGEAEPN